MRLRQLIISAALLLASISSHAREFHAGEIRIDQAYARPTMPGQTSAAAYVSVENKGKHSDKLVSVASPAAKAAEIHTMSMEGNVMKMREVPHIEIAPASRLTMKPGDGYHIMLIGIREPLKAGDQITLTLTFEKAGKTEISAPVEDRNAPATKEKSGHQHQHHHRH